MVASDTHDRKKFAKHLANLYLVKKLSIAKIANMLGMSCSTVRRRLVAYNIPLRGRNEYPNPFLGKKHSKEAKKKIGKANFKRRRGQKHSKKTKEKIRKAHLGKILSEETKRKISANHANVSGELNPMWGRSHSKQTRQKISKAISGKLLSGEEHHWYKGPGNRKTDLVKLIRTCTKYIKWRKRVYERDDYTCQFCKIRSSKDKKVYLNADHIKPFSSIVTEHSITSLEEAQKCGELWDINNGRTLCVECHKTTSTYGSG